MSTVNSKTPNTLTYRNNTLDRASLALICSPFNLRLFEVMLNERVPMGAIALDAGVKHGYTKSPISELAADNALVWLIQVGVLRREVDGQGITDSFRLTPLGRQLIQKFQNTSSWRNPYLSDRISNALTRWVRLPF